LTVRTGNDISFMFSARAAVSAGAALTIANAAPTSFRSLAAEALSDPDSGLARAVPSLWPSPGLSLVDTSGLIALGDGSYGFATPVPEPAQWAVMSAGLAALLFWLARPARVRRSVLPAG